jgi:uncharacterized membrane protein
MVSAPRLPRWEGIHMGTQLESVVTEPPTDMQAPGMYEKTVYILGGVAGMCVIGVVVLAMFGKTVDAGLIAIGASAISGLVGLLVPRSK